VGWGREWGRKIYGGGQKWGAPIEGEKREWGPWGEGRERGEERGTKVWERIRGEDGVMLAPGGIERNGN